MAILVISKLGQAIPRLVPSSHVAGDSMLERLRSTSFALCGAATAVGLGLVALAANQGLPGLLESAIPAVPREGVHAARVVARPAGPSGVTQLRRGVRRTRASSGPARDGSTAPRHQLSIHRQLTASTAVHQSPGSTPPGGHGGAGAGAPPGPPAGAPAGQQPAAAAPQPVPGPAPVTTPAPTPAEPPAAEESHPGHGKAKGHEKHAVPVAEESPPPVKEKHSHGPPVEAPVAAPSPPIAPEVPAEPEVSPHGHVKTAGPGKANGHEK
jgi:hypothetical protein